MRDTVVEIILNNYSKYAEQSAVVYNNNTYSFGEHIERGIRLATALLENGCNKGDRIAILSRNSIEYLELYIACELTGIIIVPVNFRLTQDEISYICRNTGVKILFYSPEYQVVINTVASNQPHIENFILIAASTTGQYNNSYEDLLNSGNTNLPRHPGPGDPVCIIHTSGTTGEPKGAVLTQKSLYGTAIAIKNDADISSSDNGLIMQPLFHVGAKFLQLAHHFSAANIHLKTDFDVPRVWKSLQSENITTMQVVPTMLDMLLGEDGDENKNLCAPHLKTIFYSTAPIRVSLLKRGLDKFGQVFVQQYGSTEGGLVSSLGKSQHQPGGSAAALKLLTSAGKANPGVEIRIVDESGAEVNPFVAGEITVRHENIMKEYWNNEQATRETVRDGWLYMGDIGYLDDEGYLFIVDRKKDMIISGGENIYPREVENALSKHPGVLESAVVGIPDEKWGESVLAFVIPRNGSELDSEILIDHCSELIAAYKKPRRIEFVDTLPRLATGKVDKVSLRKPYWTCHKRQII